MANEELEKRGYLKEGSLKGGRFGQFEELDIDNTSINELVACGLTVTVPTAVKFPFKEFKPPKQVKASQPDMVYIHRQSGKLIPVAVAEHKRASKRKTAKDVLKATEQALYYAIALGAPIAVAYKDDQSIYVNVTESILKRKLIYFDERRDWSPAVLQNLLAGDTSKPKDPKPLAENVWQTIWHATKEVA